MPASSVTRLPVAFHAPWQNVVHDAICGDPATVLEQVDAVALRAEQAGDNVSLTALSAQVLAWMFVDWGRFTGWQTWIARFEAGDAALPQADDDEFGLARATGALACALLRSEPLDSLTAFGQRVQSLLRPAVSAQDATHMALAAGVLLPWLQMARGITDAQILHARMTDIWQRWSAHDVATGHLSGIWLSAWAQHLHFSDQARLPGALAALRARLDTGAPAALHFRAARLAAEVAIHAQHEVACERAFHDMLSALRPERPMDRVIYNAMAATRANARKDVEAAMLHVDHMNRDLHAADCPPGIASAYRFRETGIHLAVGNYARAAEIFDQCARDANSVQASLVNGFAALARAVEIFHRHDSDTLHHERLREQLRIGMAAMRQSPVTNFFYSVPVVRGELCAMALREGIEVDFVRSALKLVPAPAPVWADENWPWAMSVRAFGGFRVQADVLPGQRTDKASSRPLLLLKLIAAHGERGVHVNTAMDALWPGQDGDQAEHALTMTLQRLRRLFAEDDLIQRNDGWLYLNAEKVWSDVRALEAHLAATPDLTAGATSFDESAGRRFIARLFDLYRGNCLSGIDDPWAFDRAATYRNRVTTAARQFVHDARKSGYVAVAELALMRATESGLDMK